jgi:AcrR family transcriptional regulator
LDLEARLEEHNEMAVSRQAPGAKKELRANRQADGSPGDGSRPDPRANQRRRTKAAIMEGARTLLREGKVPSVADAAEAAGVSRATAYRYFPTQGALVREAVDAGLVRGRSAWEERLGDAGELTERVERYVSLVFGLMREDEALMRGYLLLALEQWAKLQAGEELGEAPIKRGGRLEAISATLEPFTDQLDDAAIRRLSVALSLLVGIEAHVVFRDIWGLDDDEARGISLWMARVLAEAAAEEGGRQRR